MKKTLYIQIDNNSLPEGCGEDVEVLDCRCINDFCSLIGDALVGDLKDENDKPLYRLINPVGRLLIDFEKVDKISYDQIIAQWLDILGEMLHKKVTQCDGQFTILFPRQYVDWLLCNETDYYAEIGKYLQSNGCKVYLDADGISEDIISALHMKIRRFLNDNEDDIEYIVFSNERIGNSSHVIKQLKTVFDSYSFMRLEQWTNCLQEELNDRRRRFDDYSVFHYGPFQLGISKKEDFNLSYSSYGLHYSAEFYCELKFSSNNICSYITTTSGMIHDDEEWGEYVKDDYNKIWLESLSSICGKEMNSLKQPLAELVVMFYNKGFHIINPYNTGFRYTKPNEKCRDIDVTFWKETKTFCCRLSFSGLQIDSLVEHRIQMVKLTAIEMYLK